MPPCGLFLNMRGKKLVQATFEYARGNRMACKLGGVRTKAAIVRTQRARAPCNANKRSISTISMPVARDKCIAITLRRRMRSMVGCARCAGETQRNRVVSSIRRSPGRARRPIRSIQRRVVTSMSSRRVASSAIETIHTAPEALSSARSQNTTGTGQSRPNAAPTAADNWRDAAIMTGRSPSPTVEQRVKGLWVKAGRTPRAIPCPRSRTRTI